MKTQTRKFRIGAASRKLKLKDGCSELIIRDKDITGFTLRIRKTSARYLMQARIAGTSVRRTITIGDANSMTADAARQKAMTLRNELRSGVDPVADAATAKAEAQAQAAKAVTFEVLEAIYRAKWSAGNLLRQKKAPRPESVRSHVKDTRRALAYFGDLPVSDIDAAAVRAFLASLEAETISPSVRRKAFGALSVVLQHATTMENPVLDFNPARLFDRPADSIARYRTLSPAELSAIWETAAGLRRYGQIVRFLMAMPVRASIARHLDWSQVDLVKATIAVPPDALGNKAGIPVTLPLSGTAQEILAAQPSREGIVFVGAHGGPVALSSSQKNILDVRSGVTGWRLHDFRRTAISLAAEAHETFDEAAADLWLMHKRTGVSATYQTAARMAAMARIARQWDGVLRFAIGLPVDGAEVVAIA